MSEKEPELAASAFMPVLEPAPAVHQSAAIDVSTCDREPIHIPGSIQPHGFLLALDSHGVVVIASSNAAVFLHASPESLFGKDLTELLGVEAGQRLGAELVTEPPAQTTRLLAGIDLPQAGAAAVRHFDVVAYQATAGKDQITILEFEPATEVVDVEAINSRLYNFIAGIRTLSSAEAICDAAVIEIRRFTQCDRVVLYRFDEGGNGLVLAENCANDRFASYLGLRFPASDIPAQARRMYQVNRVRIIPNVEYEPALLLSAIGTAPEIDLSHSVLRSVSPVHRQYMRNMGTACSMSVSIIIDGFLWGLVSCHHDAPRYVPLRLRSACDFIMQIVASQIEAQQNGQRLKQAFHARGVQGRLLASMAAQDSYMEGLIRSPELLRELIHADGVAIVHGNDASLFGVTPDAFQVLHLVDWLRKSDGDELFVTRNLAAVYPEGSSFAGVGSGVIAFSVSRMHNTCLLWFRRELVQTVRWAGNPQKPAEPSTPDSTIPGIVDPRHSFEEWLQIVRGCCEPWSEVDTAAAGEFRSAILEIVLERAEELAEMASGLQVANEELEAFSYSVSHDLRAPFRHISGFSEMLKEEEDERMSARGRHYLATIMDSARFAGSLVDSLLDFSRFARSRITMVPVELESLVDGEWAAVVHDEAPGRTIAFSRAPLPRVMGDVQLLRQVFRNLFSNALKYSSKQTEAAVRVEAKREGQECIFSISDNGVGFDQQYAGKLFGVFQRLHRIEDFEGTGIGLANVRRIIGRHGGRTWAEGVVGQGATFYFTMPALFPPEEV